MNDYEAWYNYLAAQHPDWNDVLLGGEARLRSQRGERVPRSKGSARRDIPESGTITDVTTPREGYYPDNSKAPKKGGYYPFQIGGRTFRIPGKEWSQGTKLRANDLRREYQKGGWQTVRDYLVQLGFSDDLPVPTKGQNAFVLSAAQSYLRKGVSNKQGWNKWFQARYGNPNPVTDPGTDIPKDTTYDDGTPVYPNDSTAPPGNGGIEVDPVTGALLADVASQLQNFDMIDPTVYARSAVNAQYNPVISEIRRQIKQGDRQTLQNQQDIQDWYKVAMDQYGTSAEAINKYGRDAVTNNNAALTSIADVVGGDAGAAIANPMAGSSGFLTDLTASNASFAQRLGQITGLARNEQLTREQARASASRNQLQGDLTSATKSKGEALTAARQQAVGTRLEQLQAYINMALGLGNFDLSKAELALKAKGTTNPLEDELTRAQITKINTETDAIIYDIMNPTGEGVADFSTLTAGDFADLQAALTAGVDPSKTPPLALANQLGDRLRLTSNGAWDPKSNPAVRAWRNQLLYTLYPKPVVDRMLKANPGLR